jgi:hypothetical protein
MTIHVWPRRAGGGQGGIAGLMLALLVLLAAAPQSAAQEQPLESFQPPYNYQPLALAYLAAPYTGSPSGRSSDFSFASYPPGESIIARFLPRPGQLQAWEGIPFGLFKRSTSPGSATRLGVTGSALGIGSGKPLDLRLYAFLQQPMSSTRLLTYESDAWKKRPDVFSVLTDTTFVLTAPVAQGRNPKPGDSIIAAADDVACVNKRTRPPDGRSLGCEDGKSEVIEDPLTGEPALLMIHRRGPPQWLTSVPTEICVEDGKTAPSVAVPTNYGPVRVSLSERKGQRLCGPAELRLNYLLVQERGIEIDGVKYRRLGSRSAPGSGWRLLAEAPTAGIGGWTQRVLLAPPAPPPVASAPKVAPVPVPVPAPRPSPVPSASPPTFSVVLKDSSLSAWRIRKLWYGPLPGDDRSLKCEGGALSLGTAVWGKQQLTEASAVSVSPMLKLPFTLRLEVTQPPTKLQAVSKGLLLLAEGAGGRVFCGLATPLPGGAAGELEAKLQPEAEPVEKSVTSVPPPVAPVQTTSDLVFKREGPAALSIEVVSQGKVTKLADLDAASVAKSLQWVTGDKLRVRPADPDFESVSAINVDGTSFAVTDDKSVEIPLTAQTRAIAIKTALRSFTVPLVVTTPHGAVDITASGGKTTLPMDAKPRTVVLKGVKAGDEVTVEPKDADRFMVAKLTLRGAGSPRTIDGPTFKFERGDMQSSKVDLRLDVELKSDAPVVLPAELWLKPVAQLGKRSLALASCKVTLADFPAGEFRHERDGRTHVKVSQDKTGRKGASYRVEIGGSAKVCAGFEGEALQAQKLAALAKGTELTVPVRRRGGRAFVGVLSWPLGGPDDEGNWRAALKALVETFDAGADEGRYLWGAIYAADGKKLVASETADYTPLEVNAFSPETIGRFKAGGAVLRYEEAVKRILADVADLEGNVDLMVVAAGVQGACKWANPFASAVTRGGRSALVRVVKAAPGQPSDPASRARMCDVAGDQSGVGMAVEVAVDPATAGGASDRLLREALEAAAKSLLSAPPPSADTAPKAETEPPSGDRKIASSAPAPIETPIAESYQDRYTMPDDYRPLAVAYLAAPYEGSLTGPASTFRIGGVAPGASLFVRFLKRTDGAEPWEGLRLGLFRGESGKPGTRLSVAESTLGLGGSKALHPTLYAFMSDERPVAGFRMVTFESEAGRKTAEVFSLLADTSFLLKGYLDGANIGVVETVACVNKRNLDPACDDGTSQVVEDPLTGGPALLMVGRSGPPKWLTAPPKWLTAVPTDICVEGATKAAPKVAVPSGSGKHQEIPLVRQGERWCTGVTSLNYAAVREDGIRIDSEPLRKRLDSHLHKSAGAWSLRATAPKKGPGGDWVQQIVLSR